MNDARCMLFALSVLLLPAAGARAQVTATPAVQTSGARGDAAVMRPGDLLRITVWRNTELSGDVLVGADGTLEHPLYSAVHVAGLTREQVHARVRELLLRYETAPQFVVEPLARVSVLGEVRTPNLYAVQGTTTLTQLIAMAGGTTDRASGKAVVTRDGQRITVDLRKAPGEAAALVVRSRDEVMLPRRKNANVGATLGLVSALAAGAASLIFAIRAIN